VNSGIGGKIQGISLDTLLQMVQTDQMTCTITVSSPTEGSGILYIVKGAIFSAVWGEKRNAEAACQIISWEDSVIEIEESCDRTENEILQPLQHLLMEAMRLREGKAAPLKPPAPEADPLEQPEVPPPPPGEQSMSAETPPTIRTARWSRWRPPIIVVGIACLLGLVAVIYLAGDRAARSDYEALLTQIDSAPIGKKIALLQAYIAHHPGGKLTPEAEQRLVRMRAELGAQRISETERRATPLLANGDLEGALGLYEDLLKTGLTSDQTAKINHEIAGLKDRIDIQAYDRLMASTKGEDPQRVYAFYQFLKSHPQSPHRQEVKRFLSKMSQEYYYYIENKILENENRRDYDACLVLSQRYIDIYPGTENADTLTRYQKLCKHEKQDAEALQHIEKRADALGDDYPRMIKLYDEYLKAHPQSHARKAAEQQIAKVKALAGQQRLKTATDQIKQRLSKLRKRFIVQRDGTFRDARSGLTWCLLDSTTMLNRCLDFAQAKQFVAGLKIGGHTDWRLPTKEELTELYRQKPAFPSSSGSSWYWTSQTHMKYVGRWMIEVDVVTTETKAAKEVENKASWHCGDVRAVRGKRR